MKKAILRFGTYSALAELLSFVACWLILSVSHMSIDAQGNLGWAAILCPLVFIYFGVRYYRDRIGDGSITFLGALKIGLLITIMPSLFYALIETIFVTLIDPHFYSNIYLKELDEYRKTMSAAEFTAKMNEMKQEMVRNNNPLYNFSAITLFIASCRVIVSLICAVLLRKKPNPAVATVQR
jgi:hypothetical protein